MKQNCCLRVVVDDYAVFLRCSVAVDVEELRLLQGCGERCLDIDWRQRASTLEVLYARRRTLRDQQNVPALARSRRESGLLRGDERWPASECQSDLASEDFQA
jgi:hypothetical protein